jgi:mycothiol S-conjugate amidase
MSDLCLMQVHAHPDDEASKGGGVTARYAAEGVRTVLVTCTGGEAGDILNPQADTPEVRDNLFEVRMQELEEATSLLGYTSLHLLGYRDSGMPDTEPNLHPDAFANAPLEEAVGRLVALIRAERPHVLITYPEDQSAYPHPDHVRVYDISVAAFDAAADPARSPDAGEPWEIAKLYEVGYARRRAWAVHSWLTARGMESWYAQWFDDEASRAWNDDRLRTRIDIGDHIGTVRAALRAHRTQVAPDSFWFSVPEDEMRALYPWEDYHLARSRVSGTIPEDGFEEDLFAGLR